MDEASIAAYYQGMADYEAALTSGYYGHEASAEELAYYQGMADYEAALTASQQGLTGFEGMSAEEAAYYQGMADYEAMLYQQGMY